jgi:hypothetical protein
MKRVAKVLAACALLAAPGLAVAQPQLDFSGAPLADELPLGRKPGNPTLEMPAGQRLISAFGERPVFSPDGKKIAFVGESYGDTFEYDLKTGAIRNLTSHMAHKGFLRVHYLHDGSFLLLGPHVPAATREETRNKTIELFWMDAAASRPAVRLGPIVFEGIATSPRSNRIAWTETTPKGGTLAAVKGTALKTAEVVVSGGSAKLINQQDVITTTECLSEAQDFLPGDKGLTLPCYRFGSTVKGGAATEVISIDFASKQITRYPTPPQLYGEVEGIFPDGKRTLVECSGDRSAGMDMCVLELKATGPRYTRITRIMDYGRWKYGNPVVSPNGRMIAAQVGSADVIDAGVGQGIVIIDLPQGY